MENLSLLGDTFVQIFTTNAVWYLWLGVIVGTIVAIMPSLGTTAGMALLVPFVYGMDPLPALAMMTGLLAVVSTADVVPAILMGIPGAASSQATIVDGYPMAKKGEAGRALAAAYMSSMCGGVFGALVLTVFLFAAKPAVMAFGMGEQLMLALLGLAMVSLLSGRSLLKGLIACGLGMTFAMIGSAPASGEYRMPLGNHLYLMDGISLGVVALAVFAFPEIINLLRRGTTISEKPAVSGGTLQALRDVIANRWIVLRCSAIGCLIGALPLGGASWLAYGHAMQSSKDRSQFGKGDVRGVIGPESANNADTGGSLIPTLIFGIPSGGSAAIFLGGLLLLGFTPGPRMLAEQLDVTYTIIWSVAIANIFAAGMCLALSRHIAKLTLIPFVYLAPFMLTVIMFGAYNSSRHWGDLLMLFGLGVAAIYLRRFGYSRPAFLVGFILQPIVESLLYRILQVYTLEQFASRPIIWILFSIIVISLFYGIRSKTVINTEGESHSLTTSQMMPQIVFLAVVAGFMAYVTYSISDLSYLARVLPMAQGFVVLGVCVVGFIFLLQGNPNNTFVHDGEFAWRQAEEGYQVSPFYYVWWVAAFLAGIAIIGFFAAIAVFFVAFMRSKSKASWIGIGLMVAAVLGLLSVLSQVLYIEFPKGVIQVWIESLL